MAQHTINDLRIMQGLPLSVKVRMTQTRIRQWVEEYGEDGVHISFSGGKDSTVLLHLVRELYPSIPAVFVNTGLEYPEIQQFVKTFDNVEILTPKMRFTEVLTKYGYPFISKEISQAVYYVRNGGRKTDYYKMMGEGRYENSPYSAAKYKALLDADFILSNKCCAVMKKAPTHKYSHDTGRNPITGQQAEESQRRTSTWLKNGCNVFSGKSPISNPMAFWTEQDVLRYIKEENIPIASVYGEIVATDESGFEYEQTLFDQCRYKTTGCDRTGCIFCGYGAHLEKGEGRFQRLKKTHPKQYDYCMGGGAYDSDGLWKPTKEGLGMAHCIDELCRIYGKDFIRY